MSTPFKPQYGQLLHLRSLLAGVPCTALTATATPAKVAIIMKELGMAGCVQVNISPHKENIKYNVLKIGKSDDLENNFGFLVDMVLQHMLIMN